MTAESGSPRHPSEKRRHPRSPGEAYAEIVREHDLMRLASEGQLKDISLSGIGVVVEEEYALDEPVRITLINLLQKVRCEVRGNVRHSTPLDNGRFLIGVELLTLLTPLNLSLLRMGLKSDDDESAQPQWM